MPVAHPGDASFHTRGQELRGLAGGEPCNGSFPPKKCRSQFYARSPAMACGYAPAASLRSAVRITSTRGRQPSPDSSLRSRRRSSPKSRAEGPLSRRASVFSEFQSCCPGGSLRRPAGSFGTPKKAKHLNYYGGDESGTSASLEASRRCAVCRREHNQVRPHGSLGCRPPAPEAVEPAPLRAPS